VETRAREAREGGDDAPQRAIFAAMRAGSSWWVLLIAAATGAAGWFLGRASVERSGEATDVAHRPPAPPTPRPFLEGARGGRPPPGDRRVRVPGNGTTASPGTPGDGSQGTSQPSGPGGAGGEVPGGLPVPTSPPTPEPPANVVEAARLLRSSPEEAISKIEALLDSRDPRERAEGYRLVGQARHPSHQPLVQRALKDAKTNEEIFAVLHALAQFKGRDWSAAQMTGPPDTPIAGDMVTAWASKEPEMGEIWIELDYAEAVVPESVRVHETFNPGAVSRIFAQRPDGTWTVIWEGNAAPGEAPWWFEPSLQSVRFQTRRLRLISDTSRVPGWNEIDAVELIGEGRRQWATAASAASSYAD
jgi:hypothetical protein